MNRRLVLPALLLAHAGVLALAVTDGPTGFAPAAAAAIMVTAVPAPTLSAVPPQDPVLREVIAQVDLPIFETAAPVARPVPVAAASGAAGCAVADVVQAALRSSGPVRQALDRMPRDARSVADAVQLWNGHWVDAATIGGPAALDPIRTAVDIAVRAAPETCREAGIAGPQLIFVAADGGTRVLAFGSGMWSWAQLMQPNTAKATGTLSQIYFQTGATATT